LLAGCPAQPAAVCVVCPPFVYLQEVALLLRDSAFSLGGQDVCADAHGAFTGEVSAAMLKDVGCQYVIVGHSERRLLYRESDQLIARKFAAALARGLIPILCVGEQLADREAGRTREVVARQLEVVLELCGAGALQQGVVAYEPVWAIGTGRNATTAEAGAVHVHLRTRLRQGFGATAAETCRVIYGGSVRADNIQALAALPDVDGALVGGASLDVGTFADIIRGVRL
jgi:triosephosphate isomerase